MASRTRPARGQTRSIHVRSKAALLNWIFSPQTRLANVKLLHRIISQASGNPILAALMETITSALHNKRRGLKIVFSAGAKRGEGLMRRIDVSPDPVVMLDSALQEAAKTAVIELTVEDGAIFCEL